MCHEPDCRAIGWGVLIDTIPAAIDRNLAFWQLGTHKKYAVNFALANHGPSIDMNFMSNKPTFLGGEVHIATWLTYHSI